MANKRKSSNGRIALTPLRNPLHDHPLLRKSATHEKMHKAQRRADRVRTRKDWDHLSACA